MRRKFAPGTQKQVAALDGVAASGGLRVVQDPSCHVLGLYKYATSAADEEKAILATAHGGEGSKKERAAAATTLGVRRR